MKAHHTGWWAWMPLLIAATLTTSAAAGETIVKFTLDYDFEGPAALFLHPLDKGYYKSEGLNVTINPAANSIEPIERVASGDPGSRPEGSPPLAGARRVEGAARRIRLTAGSERTQARNWSTCV